MAHIGEVLKEFRNELGRTQRQMADDLSISLRTYQGIEQTGEVASTVVMQRIQTMITEHDKREHDDIMARMPKAQPDDSFQEKYIASLEARVEELSYMCDLLRSEKDIWMNARFNRLSGYFEWLLDSALASMKWEARKESKGDLAREKQIFDEILELYQQTNKEGIKFRESIDRYKPIDGDLND